MQPSDCTLRPQEGTDFCQVGLSDLAEIWAWRDTTDILFQTAGPVAICIRYVGDPHKCAFRVDLRRFRASGFSATRNIFVCMSSRPAIIKQAELTRYIKAVVAAGVSVGKITMLPSGAVEILPLGAVPDEAGPNPCDRLLNRGTDEKAAEPFSGYDPDR